MTSGPLRPETDCYWVVPESLLAGEYPRDLAFLAGIGVSAFIDLTREGELPSYSGNLGGTIHLRFPVAEGSVPESPELTSAALDAIDGHIAQGGTVYVHCMGGIGRTGTIIGCWLARHGHPGQAALERLDDLRRKSALSGSIPSPVTNEQVRYVLGWREGE